MYRLSSSNLIRKGLIRVHLFVLSLRYRSALCSNGVFSFKFRNPHSEFAGANFFMNDTESLYYNFCRIHQTLRITPVMAEGVTDHLWEIEDIFSLLS